MLKFYYSGAPNPTKIALFLEEAGLPYDPIAVDTRKGDQHKPLEHHPRKPGILHGQGQVEQHGGHGRPEHIRRRGLDLAQDQGGAPRVPARFGQGAEHPGVERLAQHASAPQDQPHSSHGPHLSMRNQAMKRAGNTLAGRCRSWTRS